MNIVMKVTKDCNLRCVYCYVDHDSNIFMPLSMVKTTIEKFGGSFKKITFLWHGGEPLLAGIDFFQAAVDEEQRFTNQTGVVFENNIQCNGTLLNDEWIEFFLKNKFIFGISYDGPNQMNGYRRDINGEPLKTDFSTLFKKLKSYHYNSGVLCVVHGLNLKYPRELYTHFKSLDIRTVNFSPRLEGREDDDYYEFYKTIFDLWTEDESPFEGISNLSDIIYNFFNVIHNQSCSWSGSCFRSNIAILPTGDIYPCLTLNDPRHCIGNVLEGSMNDIIKNPAYTQINLAGV